MEGGKCAKDKRLIKIHHGSTKTQKWTNVKKGISGITNNSVIRENYFLLALTHKAMIKSCVVGESEIVFYEK